MVFNSLHFLVFFIVVTVWFFRMQHQKSRIWLLLLSSCYFYMMFIPVYILILFFTILVDYYAGLLLERTDGRRRKLILSGSIAANLGVLVFFKYFDFLSTSLQPLLHALFPSVRVPYLDLLLPIGLSFHTFQALSYTIEVYRGNQRAEKDLAVYALYVMYYPQLVAGPIERPQNMLGQFHEFRPYNWDNVKEGLLRMSWGFFKKMVVADRVAMIVDHVYDTRSHQSSLSLVIGAIAYSVQIYCDFSGYSDIAIGASKVMGIKLMENFRNPYGAQGLAEFWKRWHISLSTWFRDYLYIPLGGNRKGIIRTRFNVFVVFILSGLWHGANWTFGLWGVVHGFLVTVFPGLKNIKSGIAKGGRSVAAIRVTATFTLVTLLWIFFRAPTVQDGFAYVAGIFSFSGSRLSTGLNTNEFLLAIFVSVLMFVAEARIKRFYFRSDILFYISICLAVNVCYFLGVVGETKFIYFQF
ncbi:MAG: MBOAT family protein [Chitinophagaceae bacterium]|nr:MBOAT family protein [Chitinophagaceae bacterium]